MRKQKTEEQVTAASVLEEFLAENPACAELAYSPEYIIANAHLGWQQLGDLIDEVQVFADGMSLTALASNIYVGAYTKFKAVGNMYERLKNEEFLRVSDDYPKLSREDVIQRMRDSNRMRGILERGEAGAKFADTKTPKVEG